MSSLAKAIIYGDTDAIKGLIEQGATINEVDEYGYSPLIQTVIVSDIEKTKIILQAGAEVDFSDLTGRTALHWAADNNNIEIAELLLKSGANPNAYSRPGQPVLVMPYLRRQHAIKKLLYRYGAKLTFAQDFVNAKSLGHRYELEGRVDIVTPDNVFIEVELEGFYLEFSLAMVEKSLRDFKVNFAGKHLKRYFDKVQIIINALANATKLIKYQHYLLDVKEHENEIDSLLNFYPLLIPTVYVGHAISLISFGDILIRCDRGEYGRDHGSVIFYKMSHPERMNKDFVKTILYKRQQKASIDQEMPRYLGLKVLDTIDLPVQISGNCSWANVEAVVPAMLYIMLMHENDGDKKQSASDAMKFYEQWLAWDKQRSLTFCMQSFDRVEKARKATKAALLAAIVFQTHEFDNENHRHIVERIFNLFRDYPDYMYILKAYLEVFQYDRDNPLYKNFMKFADYYEIT